MFWDGRAIVYATTALVGGPIMFYRGFKALRLKRLIADTPTARIRSMAMGPVEVNGTIEMRSTVNAPFSGRTCAYWEIDISTPVKNGWSIAQRDRSGNPFFLRDDDGVALVYPHDAQCTIPFGTELPYLVEMGAQACVFGPGDIRVAHRTGEFVPLAELSRAVEILAAAIERFAAP